jgi:hypothetical protein
MLALQRHRRSSPIACSLAADRRTTAAASSGGGSRSCSPAASMLKVEKMWRLSHCTSTNRCGAVVRPTGVDEWPHMDERLTIETRGSSCFCSVAAFSDDWQAVSIVLLGMRGSDELDSNRRGWFVGGGDNQGRCFVGRGRTAVCPINYCTRGGYRGGSIVGAYPIHEPLECLGRMLASEGGEFLMPFRPTARVAALPFFEWATSHS